MAEYVGFKPVKNRGATGAANWALTTSHNISGESAAVATQASVTCTATETYNISGYNSSGEPNSLLQVVVDGVTSEHELRRYITNLSAATAEQVATAMNQNQTFIQGAIASSDGDQVVITSRSYGVNASVQVLAFGGNRGGASSIFNFATTEANGTGGQLDVTFDLTDANGVQGAVGARMVIYAYNASTGTTAATAARLSVSSGARVISGLGTAEMVIEADDGAVILVAANDNDVYLHYAPWPVATAPCFVNGVAPSAQTRDHLVFA